jgi:hypothetical protein
MTARQRYLFYALLFLAAALRMAAPLALGWLQEDRYWEYGLIARNLLQGKGFSFPFVDENLNFLPNQTYPSALMPPGYVFFLCPFLELENPLRNALLFGVQTVLSLGAMVLLFHWVRRRSGVEVALISLLFQVFLPDLILAPGTVGPTVWFHFLLALVLHLRDSPWRLWAFLPAGLLVSMRSEFLLMVLVLALLDLRSRNWKSGLALLAGSFLLLSPWLIRNQLRFGKPMLSANLGVNLYRGNNPGAIGDWPSQWNAQVLEWRKDPDTYEQHFDANAAREAIEWIKTQPIQALSRLPEKATRFWLWDWSDPRTGNWVYRGSWLLALLGGILALFKPASLRPYREILWLMAVYTLIVLLFFPQVRYASLVRFFWMPLAALGWWPPNLRRRLLLH